MNSRVPNRGRKAPLKLDRTDPYHTATEVLRLVPFHVRESFKHGSNLFADDRARDTSCMRSAVWAVLSNAVDAKGRPFKPRARDIDEIVDAMTAICRARHWEHGPRIVWGVAA